MKKYKYFAYAKINLFLLVYKKETNKDFHKIDSLFFKYKDIYDEIIISLSDKKDHIIKYSNIEENTISNCLISKVLQHLSKEGIIKNFYNILIEKKIPIFSGLGGASSDLAEVLKHIINVEKISLKVIKKNVLNFSNDLTFFLYGYDLARIYNYGDKIKKINIDFHLNISLIFNDIKCSTNKIFDAFEKRINIVETNFDEQLSYLLEKKYDKLINDLKPTSFHLYPNLKKIYDIHTQNSKIVLMTGSGSTLFMINN